MSELNVMDLHIFFSTFRICSFDKITFCEGGILGYEEFEGYMKIGNIVGDSSVTCIDKNYNVCCIYEGDSEITETPIAELLEEELEFLKEKIYYRKRIEQNN